MIYVNDSSRVWHVAKTGNDTNSGHAGQYPVNLANDSKLTIQAAVNIAASGDTIIVWPGDYAENVTMAIKGNPKIINLVGVHRDYCRITPASGVPLYITDGSTLKNFSIVGATGQYVIGLGRGSGTTTPSAITVENCYVYGEQDGINISSNLILRLKDSVFESLYDGGNLRNCRNVYAENCTFKSNGSATTASHALQSPGIGIYRNCQFIMHTTISASYEVGCVSLIQNEYPDQAIFDGCTFYTIAPAGRTGQVYGIKTAYAGAVAILNNCLFNTTGPGANGGAKDLINEAGTIIVNCCRYDAGKISGAIIQSDSNLTKAVKMLTNKAVQDKLSGAIRYYDNDGQTVILTHTPSEDGSSLTRTVS